MVDSSDKHLRSEIYFKIDEATADAAMSLKTWWAIPLIQPLSRKLVVYVVNRTTLTANHITYTAIFFRLLTLLLFLSDTRWGFIVGALSYFLAYVCDCADGTVARIKKQSSELGRYLDHVSDLLGDILILLALAWSQNIITQPWIWAMVFMHVAECYISYMAGFALKNHHGTLGDFVLLSWFNRYRLWFFKRNTKSFLSFPDYTAVVFVFFPLIGSPQSGLKIGFWILLIVVSYTVLSTFVALHTEVKSFP